MAEANGIRELPKQHRDFQAQLSAEQMAREQVTNTLLMCQELEALKEAQSGPNPMDAQLVTDYFLRPVF